MEKNLTHDFPDTHHDVSSNTLFGFWLYLMTDAIMFATFFATYAVLQLSQMSVGPTAHELFDLPFALTGTIVLLLSSFTCGVAMLKVHHHTIRMFAWLILTFLLGVVFLAMELDEFSRFIAQGYTWETSAFLSSYYTLVGLHGLHIVAGLILLTLFLVQLLRRGLTTVVLRRLTCFRMYWQFLYLIWIFTFTFVYLIGGK